MHQGPPCIFSVVYRTTCMWWRKRAPAGLAGASLTRDEFWGDHSSGSEKARFSSPAEREARSGGGGPPERAQRASGGGGGFTKCVLDESRTIILRDFVMLLRRRPLLFLHAPSTALRAVPLPQKSGGGMGNFGDSALNSALALRPPAERSAELSALSPKFGGGVHRPAMFAGQEPPPPVP